MSKKKKRRLSISETEKSRNHRTLVIKDLTLLLKPVVKKIGCHYEAIFVKFKSIGVRILNGLFFAKLMKLPSR